MVSRRLWSEVPSGTLRYALATCLVGGLLGVVGAVTVAGTAMEASTPALDSADQWDTLQTANTAGWLALLGGSGLALSGLPPLSRTRDLAGASLYLEGEF